MARLTLLAVGALLALVPDRILDLYEDLAVESPERPSRQPWLRSLVQAEGLVVTVFSLLGGRMWAWLLNLTGLTGAFAFLVPERYLSLGSKFAYERASSIDWADQAPTVVRVLGAISVFLAVRAFFQRREEPLDEQ